MAKVKLELVCEEKTFVNDSGERIAYYDVYTEFDGEKIRLVPKTEDKSLFRHLIKKASK